MIGSVIAMIGMAYSPFYVSLVDVDKRVAPMEFSSFERWTFNLTNSDSVDRSVSICPRNIDRIASDPAKTTQQAFAVAFGDEAWNYKCVDRMIAAGELVSLKVYTRPYGRAGSERTIVIRDMDGAIIPSAVQE